jgi:hypothetical protein
MHCAARDVGSVRYEILRVEGMPAGPIEQGANFRHLINSNSRNHYANDMFVISTDPILSSGFGIVANLRKSLLDRRVKLRRVGNQIEQPGNGGAIIGLNHGSENKYGPRSTHFMGLKTGPSEVRIWPSYAAAPVAGLTSISAGTMHRIRFPHTAQGPLWSLGTLCPHETQPHQPIIATPMITAST